MNNLFYVPQLGSGIVQIAEEESRHIAVVLRKRLGDRLELTDGKGKYAIGELVEIGKRHAAVQILEEKQFPAPSVRLHLAIAPTKNIDRLEWMLEKAVEIGVDTITPLRCQHSERQQIRYDRLEKIVVSAMKQSLRTYLPTLQELCPFPKLFENLSAKQRFIAWCLDDQPMPHLQSVLQPGLDTLILIGPEGDFSPEEVALAQKNHCQPVTLGTARLRTETAGLYSCAAFNLAQVTP